MSSSFTHSQAFTVTNAKYLASKVVADLKRIQRFYNSPSDSLIAKYEAELIEYLKKGYLSEVTYGFQKDNKWIEPSLIYKAKDIAAMYYTDDDPGKISPNANTDGATFTSFLIRTQEYWNAQQSERDNFEASLPFSRTSGVTPGVNGYITSDKSYSSGGKSLDRSSIKNY